MVAVGVDACRGGWIAVVLRGGSPEAVHASTLTALSALLPDAHGYAVDIPIGLPERARRHADLAVRDLLGPRRSSVFVTPVREALDAPTHAQASAISKRLTGYGVSQQAFALRKKILEAERWVASMAVPVWEVHPELSFAMLLDHPAHAPKKTWSGMRERLAALADAGLDLGDLGEAGAHAAPDDVLDAAAAAWSAARLLHGGGRSVPERPETDPTTGRPVAIWV